MPWHGRKLLVFAVYLRLWTYISLFVFGVSRTTWGKLSPEGRVVYPQFLEGRSSNGARVLKLNDKLTLHLERKPAYDEKILLRETREDNVIAESFVPTKEFNSKLFADAQQMASAVITEEGGLRVYGIIGDELRIRPLATMERTAEGHVPHLLYRAESLTSELHKSDYVPMPISEYSKAEHGAVVIEGRSTEIIKPEIHMVIDSVYYRLFSGKENDIIAYFGAALNSINLRYKTIKDPKVIVKITGFTFHKHAHQDNFFATFARYGHPDQNDIRTTLENFKNNYMRYHRNLFEKADAFTLVTGREMCSIKGNTLSCLVAGLAYVGGVCSEFATSIIEDKPWSYGVVRNLAHELAHNLGCVHDGDDPDRNIDRHPGAKKCPWSDGYIMSYVQESTKQYRFSPCCVAQIRHVANLQSRACLRQNNTGTAKATKHYLPGTNMSLDEICRMAYKHVSDNFYFDKAREVNDCKVPCRGPSIHSGLYMRHHTGHADALDGTPCPREKTVDQRRPRRTESIIRSKVAGPLVCIRGKCVPDPSRKKNWRKKNQTTKKPKRRT